MGITPNTPINRRLFWHYWPRHDDLSEIAFADFNIAWIVLERIYLSQMDCPLIGRLIAEWLSYANHGVYELSSNNCQHFVRDFVAPLDVKIAERLRPDGLGTVKSIIPVGVITAGIDAKTQSNFAKQKLWPVIAKYKEEKANQAKEEKEEDFLMNFDNIANELGISISPSNSMSESIMLENEE